MSVLAASGTEDTRATSQGRPEDRLRGKVAFVTGAARGQGRSHAIELARAGADVIVLDIARELEDIDLPYELGTADELAQTADEVRRLGRRVAPLPGIDVRDGAAMTEALGKAVAELGGLDIVVGNAGIGMGAVPAHLMADDVWDRMLEVNLTGVWKTVKASIPHLLARGGGGSIVLTSSMAGFKGHPGIAHYVAAKHGVVGLMRTIANELAGHGIRVNTVHPTQVDTPMIMNDLAYRLFRPDLEHPTRDDFAEVSQAMHALPVPWADPIDVSNAVVFLASDEARLITGTTLPIDAGLLVKIPGS